MDDSEDVYRWLLTRLYRAFWRIKLANSEPARLKAEARRMACNATTLTDDEREAVEYAIATLAAFSYPTLPAAAATLRKMMERLA